MPNVSVIISTFNRSERLKKAIQSVLDQTFQDFEIIVVDDASKDSTEYAVKNFNDKRIKYIKRSKNFGNDTKPKNEGILASKGEYIAFLDSDNTYRKDHLQALYQAITSDSRTDVVYGDRWLIDETGKIKPQLGVYSEYDPAILYKHNFIDTSDVLVKREALFKVGGWDERFSKYVDWNLWLRMSKAGLFFKRVPLVLTDYYLHSEQKSSKVTTENEKKFMEWTGQFENIPDWKPITKRSIEDFGAYDLEIRLPYLGEIKEPRVAIFTLTHDRLDYTKECFNSLHKTAGFPFKHFIFDNGSKDGTVEWLEKYEKEHDSLIIYSDDNKGISIGSNRMVDAIKSEDFDIIVKVDNDCNFITDGWLAKMVDIWKSNHRLALSPYIQGLRDNPGGAMRISYGTVKNEYVGVTKHLGGICHFVDADAYKFFRWDTHDFLHSRQDLELSRYLIMNKFQLAYLENFFAEHYHGTEGQEKDYPEYFERRKEEKTKRYET